MSKISYVLEILVADTMYKQLKCLCKMFTKFTEKFHTHTCVVFQALSFFTLSLIRRTAYARAQFSGRGSTTNVHSETEQMAVCCQNLTLGELSSRSALSVLDGALFEKFGIFLNTPRMSPLPEMQKVIGHP